jgi:hypothetical protein
MSRARVFSAATALASAALALVVITGRPKGALAAGLLAAGIAVALIARGRSHARRATRVPLVLALLLLVTVVHFHAAGGRIAGDGVSYYVYVRSLMKDADLDFTNEYTHYELIDRADLSVPTRTGHRRSIFAVGPGLAWIPFFVLGEAVARVESALGREVDLSGYGPEHVNAVALGSLLYGFLAVVLIHDVLGRHFPASTALLAALLVWWATFLHWYMVYQPTMSHATSTFGAALVLWLWDRTRERLDLRHAALLGLAAGFAMCLRWQNALLLLLPAWDLVSAWRRAPRRWTKPTALGLSLAAGALVGAAPQMAAWKAIYGEWLLRYPPHGADFLRLDHPYALQTLFSSRHGLLSWTPVLWGGYLGFLWLARRRAPLAWPLLPPLLAMTYVNMCSGDWWAGGSFSNRRFDSLLPLLALGLAGSLEAARRALAHHPQLAVSALIVPAVAWNLGTLAQVHRSEAAADGGVTFPGLVGGTARWVAARAGSPPTWPASWLFAWRHALPPGQYDRAVGRYLFYRQNNLGGRIVVGRAADEGLLGEGWGPLRATAASPCRALYGPARVLAPLDVPEDLDLAIGAVPETAEVRVAINGRDAGRLSTDGRATLRLGAALWRRELNDVVLAPVVGPVCVAALDFVRAGAPDAPRGFQAR